MTGYWAFVDGLLGTDEDALVALKQYLQQTDAFAFISCYSTDIDDAEL